MNTGIELAAQWVQKRRDDYVAEHGYRDLGALSFGTGASARDKEEYVAELEEIIEGIRALAADEVAPQPRCGWPNTECWHHHPEVKDKARAHIKLKRWPNGEVTREESSLAQQSDFRGLESVSATTRPCRDKTSSDTATEAPTPPAP